MLDNQKQNKRPRLQITLLFFYFPSDKIKKNTQALRDPTIHNIEINDSMANAVNKNIS